MAEERIKVTFRLQKKLYDRLLAWKESTGGVPYQKLVERVLNDNVPQLPKKRGV